MKTIKKLFLLLIILQMVSSEIVCAQSKSNNLWTVASSDVKFRIKNAKVNVDGAFTGLVAKINFDPLKPESSSFEAKVDVNTIKTGIDMRDGHLKKAEYFDVAKYPEINIKSTSVTKISEGQYNAKCTLTVKGKSKEINIPFSFVQTGNKALFKGTFDLNRLDFGV